MTTFQPFDPATMSGKVALITGAGGGIGVQLARRFAGLDMRLALADIRKENLERTLEAVSGAEAIACSGDLAVEPAVRELFRQIRERFGRVDVVVNAAGLMKCSRLEEIDKAEWDQVMDANVGNAFLVCREACAPMREQGSGAIVNFSSLAATVGGIVAGAHYAAAKAAVISLTRSLARYMAPHGVRCNAVAPSGVETDMLWMFSEEQRETLVKGIPLGRFGTPEEIAELVLWLVSPASAYITGQTIHANGGAFLS